VGIRVYRINPWKSKEHFKRFTWVHHSKAVNGKTCRDARMDVWLPFPKKPSRAKQRPKGKEIILRDFIDRKIIVPGYGGKRIKTDRAWIEIKMFFYEFLP